MRFLLQFSTAFIMLTIAVLEIGLGIAAFQEFKKRTKERYLLAVGILYLILAVSNLTDVAAQLLQAQGFTTLGMQIAGLPPKINLTSTILVAYITSQLFMTRRQQNVFVPAAIVMGILAAMTWGWDISRQVFGVNVPVDNVVNYLANYGTWMAIHLIATVLAGVAWFRGRRNGTPNGGDLYLFVGGILTILMAMTIGTLLVTNFESGIPLVYLILLASVFTRYLGMVSKRHPDRTVREKPMTLVRGRIVYRLLSMTGIFFCVSAFLLMFLVADRMVGQIQSEHQMHISHSLGIADQSMDIQYANLKAAAEQRAESGQYAGILTDYRNGIPHPTAETEDSRRVSVFDAAGNPVFRETSTDGIPYPQPGQSFFAEVLTDQSDIDISLDRNATGPIDLVMTVAAQIRDERGQAVGILAVTEPLTVDIVSACRYGGEMPISGCGWFNIRTGRIILDRHHSNNTEGMAERLYGMVRRGQWHLTPTEDHNGHLYMNVPTANDPGSLFVIITQADYDRETLRIVSVINVWTFSFLVILTYFLFRAVEVPLRPLRPLQLEAERLEAGMEPDPIAVKYPDEIGKLSDTFNRMAKAIETRSDQLNRKVQEQRDFIAFTVHELKTPLSAFRWALESIETDDGKMTQQQKDLTAMLTEASDRMRNLVNDLMRISRLERGKIEIGLKQVPFGELAQQSCTSIMPIASNRGINLTCETGEVGFLEVVGDDKLLRHVLDNYLTNAVKYSRNNGQVSVRVSLADAGRSVLVRVQDNGMGIPKGDQDKIFGMFFRASNAKASEVEGSGLGLNIAKRFVEMHGGRVWFESEEGKGSTFYFQIPVSGPPQPPDGKESGKGLPEGEDGGTEDENRS